MVLVVLSPKLHSQFVTVPIPASEKSENEVVLFKHTLLKLKLANGLGKKFNFIKSLMARHFPLFVDVNVKFTKPAATSAALGM
jgi:hypothetical protein